VKPAFNLGDAGGRGMNRILVGALGALLLVASGIFWSQGRAAKRAR